MAMTPIYDPKSPSEKIGGSIGAADSFSEIEADVQAGIGGKGNVEIMATILVQVQNPTTGASRWLAYRKGQPISVSDGPAHPPGEEVISMESLAVLTTKSYRSCFWLPPFGPWIWW